MGIVARIVPALGAPVSQVNARSVAGARAFAFTRLQVELNAGVEACLLVSNEANLYSMHAAQLVLSGHRLGRGALFVVRAEVLVRRVAHSGRLSAAHAAGVANDAHLAYAVNMDVSDAHRNRAPGVRRRWRWRRSWPM